MKRTFTQAALAAGILFGLSQAVYANGINSPAGVDVQIGAGGNRVITITSVQGLVGIGTATPHANLSVNGGVQVGTDTVCDDTKAGTLSYDSSAKQFKFCDGAKLQTVGGNDGGAYGIKTNQDNGGCESPNPLTSKCTCPSGFSPVMISENDMPGGYASYSNEGFLCVQSPPPPPPPPVPTWVAVGAVDAYIHTTPYGTDPSVYPSPCGVWSVSQTGCTVGQTTYVPHCVFTSGNYWAQDYSEQYDCEMVQP